MYELTLTYEERQAIDWVGYRYLHGDELYKLLMSENVKQSPDNVDWDDDSDLTFCMPEHIAWEIRENAEQEDYQFTCFAEELKIKMLDLCFGIV